MGLRRVRSVQGDAINQPVEAVLQQVQEADRRWRCKAGVLAALAVTLGVVFGLLLGHLTATTVTKRLDNHFAAAHRTITFSVQDGIDDSMAGLRTLASVFESQCEDDPSPFISFNRFTSFANTMQSTSQQLIALEFLPRVADDVGRAEWEARALQAYGPEIAGGGFRGLNASGQLSPSAPNSGPYMPIAYMTPVQGNEAAILFETNSSPARAATMHKAATTGTSAASAILRLVQDEPGVVVFYPVYACNASMPSGPAAHESNSTYGFVVALVRVSVLLDGILPQQAEQHPDLWMGVSVDGELVYTVGNSAAESGLAEPAIKSGHATRSSTIALRFSDRTWVLKIKEVDTAWIGSAPNEIIYAIVSPIVAGIAAAVALVFTLRNLHNTSSKMTEAAIEAADHTHQYMVTYVCHELRNPLHACLSHIELVLADDSPRLQEMPRRQLKDLHAARAAAVRMSSVLDEVVDMNHSWGDQPVLHPSVVENPSSVVRDAANRYRMLVDPAVKLLLNVDADLPPCYLDAGHFRQVVGRGMQLAANSTSSGSIWVTAGLLPVVGKKWLLSQVRYSALPHRTQLAWSAGVAASEGYTRLKHIAEVAEEVVSSSGSGTPANGRDSGDGDNRYWLNEVGAAHQDGGISATAITTSKVLRSRAGQGMQLDLCWAVTEALGGLCGIWHRKVAGKHLSVFWVCVPLHPLPPEVERVRVHVMSPPLGVSAAQDMQSAFTKHTPNAATGSVPPTPAGNVRSSGSSSMESKASLSAIDFAEEMVVAVVDDEPMLRKICKRFLKKAHVKCVLMPDGVDLLSAMLQEDNPDRITVILLDIVMHKSNGVTVCKSLRDAGVKVPIFAMTANVDSVHRQAYAEAGFSGVLAKPFSSKEMRECLGLPPAKRSRRQEAISPAVSLP